MKKGMKNFMCIAGGILAGGMVGSQYAAIQAEKRMDAYEKDNEKFRAFYNLLVQWMMLKNDGNKLSEYLELNQYHTIAVYGMKELGQLLVDELQDTDVSVAYIIDQNKDKIVSELPCYYPDDKLPEVDAVVVTAIYYYQEIEERMCKKIQCPIISLEDLVYGLA